MQIYPIQQRPRDPVEIFEYGPGRTGTLLLRMIIIAARAGIHRRDQYERGREFYGKRRPADRHSPVFPRLSHGLERAPNELRQLVQEQHTIMGQGDLTRLRYTSAADERHRGYSVVRRTKRTLIKQRSMRGQLAGHAMDLRRFQRLLQTKRRQDGR